MGKLILLAALLFLLAQDSNTDELATYSQGYHECQIIDIDTCGQYKICYFDSTTCSWNFNTDVNCDSIDCFAFLAHYKAVLYNDTIVILSKLSGESFKSNKTDVKQFTNKTKTILIGEKYRLKLVFIPNQTCYLMEGIKNRYGSGELLVYDENGGGVFLGIANDSVYDKELRYKRRLMKLDPYFPVLFYYASPDILGNKVKKECLIGEE